ncbi:MAG: nuclear transport factor 2 family protein [Jatrophihabitans sp.]|uniref:nuclear transport factor 2 family protein n=1 Tax=Jatrophihabitans sp. TaxID=1932789 RepID=UPI003F7E1A88
MPFTARRLEDAFAHYQDVVVRCAATAEWEGFVQLFTPDAEYEEHAFGTFHGHDEIRAWVTRTMGTFPGSAMTSFPVAWHLVDVERGRVVCEIRNLMRDPGDGSVHETSNLTILTLADDADRWRREEDVYNPARFGAMVQRWAARAAALGTLTDDERRWIARAMPGGVSA